MRLALGIEYDGAAYNGWQRQNVGRGVQEVLEGCISQIANEPIETVCAGRTDTGVHARGQVVHFDTTAVRDSRSWLLGINTALPDDVNVCWVKDVAADFHARYHAISRSYHYRILNRLVRSALARNRCWWVHQPLDAEAMQQAGLALLGKHDFSAFRTARCQARNPSRTILDLSVRRDGDWIDIHITGNAFLHHMVRNITGTLVAVGNGQQPVSWANSVLESRDRCQGGITAPPQGLTLTAVGYPERSGLG